MLGPPLASSQSRSLRACAISTAQRPEVRAPRGRRRSRCVTRDGTSDPKARAIPLYEKRLVGHGSTCSFRRGRRARGARRQGSDPGCSSSWSTTTTRYVRQMAINALGEIGDPRASPVRPSARFAMRDPRCVTKAIIAFARASNDAAAVIQALLDAPKRLMTTPSSTSCCVLPRNGSMCGQI